MKKFSISLFILLVFSALVFFIGWTQFKVKAENVGVVISKTSGVDPLPVENGKFSWHWQFLLPTNAILRTFEIKPVNTTKTVSGELPSGNLYSSIFNSSDNFSYSFSFSISLTISPQAIIELVKLNKITNTEDLHEYLETAAGMVIGLGKNKDLIKIAKPKAEAAQNEAVQAQKKVAKTTEVIEPLKSEQIKPKKKMAGPNMH